MTCAQPMRDMRRRSRDFAAKTIGGGSGLRAVLFAVLSAALSGTPSAADDAAVQVCKKKATSEYRLSLRQCSLSERGFRPPIANCRPAAQARYDLAMRQCAPVVERKAGGDPLPYLTVPPPKDPKPK